MPFPRGPFAGRCRGGPWDGKDFVHDRPTYLAPMMPSLSWYYAPKPPDRPHIKYGTYRFVANNWIWRADDADC